MSSLGTIIARVYTSYAELPIKGAAVAFTSRAAGGKHTLLALRFTDESGKTAPVSFATSDVALSTNPGSAAPYALSDLWVYYPGFELFVAENVQIFPGVKTVQKVELIPLPLHTHPHSRAEVVLTPPQDL